MITGNKSPRNPGKIMERKVHVLNQSVSGNASPDWSLTGHFRDLVSGGLEWNGLLKVNEALLSLEPGGGLIVLYFNK